MKLPLICYVLLFIILISCDKNELRTEIIFVEPDLTFNCADSSYNLPYQYIGNECSYYINTIEKPGNVIIGYQVSFRGANNRINIYFQHSFVIDSLENKNDYFKNINLRGSTFSGLDTSQYKLSKKEFESLFVIGKNKINQTGYNGLDGGVIVYFQEDFRNDIYISSEYKSDDLSDNYFYVEEIVPLKLNDVETDYKDYDFELMEFNEENSLYLVTLRFDLVLVNTVTSGTMHLQNGHSTFVVHN
jgi:hypothetical protein